jgi:hypothetical protein
MFEDLVCQQCDELYESHCPECEGCNDSHGYWCDEN